MKTYVAATLLVAAALATAQSLFTYRDPSGDVSVSASGGYLVQEKGGTVRLELKGSPVKVSSRADGLVLAAPQVTAVVAPKAETKLQRAWARGGLTATRTTGGGNSVLRASSATYADKALKMSGKVDIKSQNTAKRQVLHVTGSGGTAMLGSAGQGIQNATLGGPVRVEARQEGGSTLVATGSRLAISTTGNGTLVALIGGVNVTGKGENAFGELSGAGKVELALNAQGEVSSVRVSQGASQ